MPIEVWPGVPYPLGATFDGAGTNFAVFSEVAQRIELCLFDPPGPDGLVRETRAELPPCSGARSERCFTVGRDDGCADTETQLAFRLVDDRLVDDRAEHETLTVACDVDVDAALEPSIGETRALD